MAAIETRRTIVMWKPLFVGPADPVAHSTGSRHHTLPQLGRSSDATQQPNHGREMDAEGSSLPR